MKVATQCRRGTAEEIRGIGQATRDFARNAKVLGKPWFEHSARAAAALNSWKLTVVDNASGLFKSLDMVFDGCNADIQILADQFCEISQRSSKLAGDNAEKDPALFR